MKINGGLGGVENPNRVAVIVIENGAVADTLAVHTACKLLQISDAKILGIKPDCDDAKNRLDHYHLSEVYRLSPETLMVSNSGILQFLQNLRVKAARRNSRFCKDK